ncbi:DUF29 domain-containing protein [Aphanothece hegewaldii CCALA 016]|uniref:DUF29 domain-containing protein n=1 Tax=Aphanothece hegewaldii CCALA 016 TaxID=2107694 RepID=A0A2T1LWX8_9CHRO|nr:DUF29 domain-containing protein [Aphanothece hegewaldii]PSF36650.1 DUF29 domain-containing protein [Aphanothece hegewaldii CCALA 016]
MTVTQSTSADSIQNPNLYEQDFYQWIETTVNLLRERKLNQLDYDNLIEELESMGRSEKRAVKSNLEVVLLHLLKWKYEPEYRSRSWQNSIREHRKRIHKLLQDSPSLNQWLTDVFDECYQVARNDAAYETGLPIEQFPSKSPFLVEETLNSNYLPD